MNIDSDRQRQSLQQQLRRAVDRLRAGRLVALPTETVYGLAADATNAQAVEQVFLTKGRPADHPLIVHCHATEQAWQCAASVGVNARRLAAAFWPGPLTLVLPRADWVFPAITGGQDSVAVRVPGHELARSVLERLGRPVVAPSANRFGRVSPTCAAHVRAEFPDGDVFMLDGGPCEVGIESTIVDCRHPTDIAILRPGRITTVDLLGALGTVSKPRSEDAQTVRVSGNLKSHYSPQADVVLLDSSRISQWLDEHAADAFTTLVIACGGEPRNLPTRMRWHKKPTDETEFARVMYALLRLADEQRFDRVAIELPTGDGVGLAIRDRLTRAAHRDADTSGAKE
ncbi:MAG: L-threonylcarbamoyladenylate synthase [Pirellulaceae bacterium]|nr:threonylcarbamoyl-AMP synthase [Planctomycetales bacterium]